VRHRLRPKQAYASGGVMRGPTMHPHVAHEERRSNDDKAEQVTPERQITKRPDTALDHQRQRHAAEQEQTSPLAKKRQAAERPGRRWPPRVAAKESAQRASSIVSTDSRALCSISVELIESNASVASAARRPNSRRAAYQQQSRAAMPKATASTCARRWYSGSRPPISESKAG